MMLIVTLLSLGVAAVSGLMAWRVLRAERLRSAARVLSLESAIDGEEIVYRTIDADASDDFAWETPELALAPQAPPNRLLGDGSVQHEPSSRHWRLLTAAGCLVAGVVVIVL